MDHVGGLRSVRIMLNGPQAQRPQVLILDEATSCLDSSGEAAVISRLRSMRERLTLIVVSHRASTVQMFSRLVVISKGRIIRDETATTPWYPALTIQSVNKNSKSAHQWQPFGICRHLTEQPIRCEIVEKRI